MGAALSVDETKDACMAGTIMYRLNKFPLFHEILVHISKIKVLMISSPRIG